MKKKLTRILVCPLCKGDLTLAVRLTDECEIVEGNLHCRACALDYPIASGVPRFVADSGYAKSFAFEWHRFRLVQLDSANGSRESQMAFGRLTGLTIDDVRDALVMDAGVGAGRYCEVVANWGAEVVGVDITGAVDAAYRNIGRHPRVHLVQADIFALPFRQDTFDLTYSIGVLHHTPSPEDAFHHVAKTVKPGGTLAIYVYAAMGLGRHFSDAIRVLTARLPLAVTYVISSIAVPLYFPYRLPFVGRVLQTLLPISLHPHWRWRWLDTFDWYSPRYQWKHTYPQVLRWFRIAGFSDIYAADEAICIRAVKKLQENLTHT